MSNVSSPRTIYSAATPLQRDGLTQPQRRLPALDPAYARLDERSEVELLAFAAAYAQRLLFYPAEGGAPDTSTWGWLLPALDETGLAAAQQRVDNPPHFALFLAFLKLFGLAQAQLNAFTGRHLDYYYREVLRLEPRPAVSDEVHLTFELARGVASLLVPGGTTFEAGSDEDEQPTLYRTAADHLLNRASLAGLRAYYARLEGYDHPNNETGDIYFAPAVNTADGVAAPLPATAPAWSGFEPSRQPVGPTQLAWPEAQVGFALAAPVLRMAGGHRQVQVILGLSKGSESGVSINLPVRVQLTGPTGWIDVLGTQTLTIYNTKTGQLIFNIADDAPAVVDYSPGLHGEGYVTETPVLRILLPHHQGSTTYDLLRNQYVSSVQVAVEVVDLRQGVNLSNDFGPLEAAHPFQPFGPAPEAGTGFYVDCPEASAKALTNLSVGITEWLNAPRSLAEHYAGYDIPDVVVPRLARFTQASDHHDHEEPVYATNDVDLLAVVRSHNLNFNDTYEQYTGLRSYESDLSKLEVGRLFHESETYSPTRNFPFESGTSNGFIQWAGDPTAPLAPATASDSWYNGTRVQGNDPQGDQVRRLLPNHPAGRPAGEHLVAFYLGRDFGHSQYGFLLQLLQQEGHQSYDGTTAIVKAPYTPLAKSLVFSYRASTDVVRFGQPDGDGDDQPQFVQRSIQLLHQAPFGWAEEHAQLKQSLGFLTSDERNSAWLLPRLSPGGTLLVGLRDAVPGTTVPVLLQVAEGTANPSRLPCLVRWSVLCHNQWQALAGNYQPRDATNGLLTSGIVEFMLPPDDTTTNTLLPAGTTWLRAELRDATDPSLPAPPDSVARLLGVHPQAVRADYAGAGDDLAHFAAALPAGSITRVRQAPTGLKAVQQPYPAFGGRPAEDAPTFRTRVSEWLRHRQRASTPWDYEHLVLAQFPELHRVRCLRHTRPNPHPAAGSRTSPEPLLLELVPGWLTLVVVPNRTHAPDADPLLPATNGRLLADVAAYVRRYVAPQVQLVAVSPRYEAVQVAVKVAFQPGVAFEQGCQQLEQALRDYLAPWAGGELNEPDRNRVLTVSAVRAFIQAQPYVDRLRDVLLTGNNRTSTSQLTALAADMLLTSAPTHDIQLLGGS